VTSGYVNVSGSTETIIFPTARGRARVGPLVPAGAFRDAGEETSMPRSRKTISLLVKRVAIPVARVDRQSYGVINNNIVPAFADMVAPTGTTQCAS
jgi:hypothetical protein